MKLIIQIPCFNEEETLPVTVKDLPRELPGVDTIEYMVIDDGSSDRTCEVAQECGVHHIVGFSQNRGLAKAFMLGLNTALDLDADLIVNTDADNQYCGEDIEKLVAPVLKGEADIVIGDRQTHTIDHFSHFKKFLQHRGSIMISMLSATKIPDATSGFRAFSRDAALEINIISDFSYTLESVIQAGRKRLAVKSVPISTNEKLRESRLFKSMFTFVKRSGATAVRVYTTYEPLKVFFRSAGFLVVCASLIFARFLYYFLRDGGAGHIQSLILGAVLVSMAGILAMIGILSDMITANRKLLEELLRRAKDQRLR